MRGELDMALMRYETVRSQQHDDPQALSQLDMVAELVQSKKALVDKANERVAMLTVRSTGDGIILPPPPKPAPR